MSTTNALRLRGAPSGLLYNRLRSIVAAGVAMLSTKHLEFDGGSEKSDVAADRNKQAILEVMQKFMDQSQMKVMEISSGKGRHIMHFAANFPNATFQPSECDAVAIHAINALIDDVVMEISSGKGRHIMHFAANFPNATFQPSECDAVAIHAINALIDEKRLPNVRVPLFIDCAKPITHWLLPEHFGAASIDVILNINMIHVSSNAAVDGLFNAAGVLLKKDTGLLMTYGAYAVDGRITPESNVKFDKTIRGINPEWGLRDVSEVKEKAANNGLHLYEVFDMPANNKMLVFGRQKP